MSICILEQYSPVERPIHEFDANNLTQQQLRYSNSPPYVDREVALALSAVNGFASTSCNVSI
eukprot:scaffold6870_cov121-Cylindrotheca_fusiformis.AAC.15